MPTRYQRHLVFFFLALTLNILFFCWTKILVSLESVVKNNRHRQYLPSPINITQTTLLTWRLENLTSPPPAQLFSALSSLASPVTPIDPETHTIALNHRLHPIFIDTRNSYWNPSIISLPLGAPAEYLLIARVLTNGLYQQTVVCFANWTEDYESLNCVGERKVLDIPPTAARLCGQANSTAWEVLANIPGLHDGRVMWTDRGEVLMIGGTQSRYTCFSLSLLTLSSPMGYQPLYALLPDSPISYPVLTELRRPPPYAPMEKNWLLFFSPEFGTFAQYELSPRKRTFAKLLGGGYVTQNLTSPLEAPCLGFPYPITLKSDSEYESRNGVKKDGWHQATNSLRLVLCDRRDLECQVTEGIEVFIAVVQRKRHNRLGLVSRYERVVVIWEGKLPFRIVAVGKARILLERKESDPPQEASHAVLPSTTKHKWEGATVPSTTLSVEVAVENSTVTLNSSSATTDPLIKRTTRQHFTFMVSIAFDHTRRRIEEGEGSNVGEKPEEMYMGYLDDYLIAGMGVGDEGMGVIRVSVRELLAGIAICPGFENWELRSG